MKKHGKIFEVPREAQAVNRASEEEATLMDSREFLAWLTAVIVITALILRS